ncbi:hypothetical protein GCM10029992_36690 [Glycomyces albus]
MPSLDWNVGDQCRFRPVFTLPAQARSHWKLRSPYYATGQVKQLQRTRFGVVALVELDAHSQLPIAECDRIQAVTLAALHPADCRCHRCRNVPHDRRSWPWPLRLRHWARHTARRGRRALARPRPAQAD